MKRLFWIIAVVVSLLAGLCAAPADVKPAAAAVNLPDLFLPVDPFQTQSMPETGALRARQAQVNRAVLAQVQPDSSSLQMTLFEDAVLSATFTARTPSVTGGTVLSGTLAGLPGSEIALALEDGALMLSANTGSAIYRARSLAGDRVLVEELRPELPGVELEPLPPPVKDESTVQPLPALGSPGGDDDGRRIDLLVVYTSALTSQLGSTTAVNNLINLAVSESNTGYANSQVTQRVYLAGTMQVTWDEASFDWNNALFDITDGVAPFQDVPAMRDTVRADLVVLLVTNESSCGIGWLMTSVSTSFHSYGFTVVSYSCATGYYTFAHEQGHNEGAHHDRTTAGSGQGAYPYSYGFWLFNSNPSYNRYTHRTIMAYNCPTSCARVNYWSNPGISYTFPSGNSTPMGIASGQPNAADNHLTLNNTSPTVAKFRDGLPPKTPTGLSSSDLSATSFRLNWTDASSDELGFKVYRASQGGTDWAYRASVGVGVITYDDTGLPAGVNYQYKVTSYSGNGESGFSNTILATHLTTPTGLGAAAVSQVRINMTWTDTNLSESGYKVERSPNGSTGWVQIGTTAANATTYSDDTLVCATPYYYRIRAYAGSLNSEYSNNANATTSPCTTPPAPTIASCNASAHVVTVAWNNVDGETSFDVEYKLNSASTWTSAGSTGKDVLKKAVAGLVKNTPYNARVRAVNGSGPSAYAQCNFTTKPYEIFTPLISR